jgi:hypothetical protein
MNESNFLLNKHFGGGNQTYFPNQNIPMNSINPMNIHQQYQQNFKRPERKTSSPTIINRYPSKNPSEVMLCTNQFQNNNFSQMVNSMENMKIGANFNRRGSNFQPQSNAYMVPNLISNQYSNTSLKLPSSIIRENYEEEEDFYKFLQRIDDNLVQYIKTQTGSRFMQKFLNKISPIEIDFLIKKISPFFKDIMTDQYGNYFLQKLAQCCSFNQRILILENVRKFYNLLNFR